MLITHVTLKRISHNRDNLFGHLTVHTKNYGRFMFNTIENYEKRIEGGDYPLFWSYSNRFGRFTLEVGGVPGRTGLRIHSGNYGREFSGCIGIGLFGVSEDIPTMVFNSKLAVKSLERMIDKHFRTRIKIIDYETKISRITGGEIGSAITELINNSIGRTNTVGFK